MKTIIVKDYIYPGNYIVGHFERIENGIEYFILDDGDIYPLKELEGEGYKIVFVNSDDIIEAFKFGKFKKCDLCKYGDTCKEWCI